MTPLANYPARPVVGEAGGVSGWPVKRNQYDDALESNIETAYNAAMDSVQSDNLRLPIVLTEAEYQALPTKVPGQLYLTTAV